MRLFHANKCACSICLKTILSLTVLFQPLVITSYMEQKFSIIFVEEKQNDSSITSGLIKKENKVKILGPYSVSKETLETLQLSNNLNVSSPLIDIELKNNKSTALSSKSASSSTKPRKLSPREKQVMNLLSEGYSKKEAAEKLELSYHTIALYTRNILKKLQVPNAAAAIAVSIRNHLI